MKIPSNKLRDIRYYMHKTLEPIYGSLETDAFAFLLFEAYVGVSKTDFFMNPEKTVSESVLLDINRAIKKLVHHTPVQYIVGYTFFMDLKISVNPFVLIPRPETELLAEMAITHVHKEYHDRPLSVLDACTGSGALALALKNAMPNCRACAFDISEEALKIARLNALNLKLDVTFFKHDMLKGDISEMRGRFDVILCNPPYVRTSEKKLMKPNVLEHEPLEALFVPDNHPLIFYEALALKGRKLIREGGRIFCEINEALAHETANVFKEHAYGYIEIIKDLNSKDRFIVAGI